MGLVMVGSRVLVLGVGGLGSAVAWALAVAGVECLTLVDSDEVVLSNLHRQFLYHPSDLGRSKVEVAAKRLREMNSQLEITAISRRMTVLEELVGLAGEHDMVVDGTDNFATRFLANDAALISGQPLVHGAATGLRGQLMTILPWESACLRCLFGGPPPQEGPTCRQAGVLGPLVAEVGWLMALEVVKYLALRRDKPLGGPGGRVSPGGVQGQRPEEAPKARHGLLCDRLLTLDLKTGVRRSVGIRRQPDCCGCGLASTYKKPIILQDQAHGKDIQ